MTLREQMQADVAAVFLNTDEHAELITYRPARGEPREIAAIVNEDVLSPGQEGLLEREHSFYILAARDGTTGIDSPQAGDTISFTRGGLVIVARWAGDSPDADPFSSWHRFTKVSTERMGGNFASR